MAQADTPAFGELLGGMAATRGGCRVVHRAECERRGIVLLAELKMSRGRRLNTNCPSICAEDECMRIRDGGPEPNVEIDGVPIRAKADEEIMPLRAASSFDGGLAGVLMAAFDFTAWVVPSPRTDKAEE